MFARSVRHAAPWVNPLIAPSQFAEVSSSFVTPENQYNSLAYTFPGDQALYRVESPGNMHGQDKPWEQPLNTAEQLYEELIHPIEDKMMACVARIVGNRDEAADVFQDVLEVIWRKLRRIHRHANPHAYIMQICVSRSYDELRRRSRRRQREIPLVTDTAPSTSPDPRRRLALADKETAVRKAIAELPRKQGLAILLHLAEGEPYKDVAAILGCSVFSARSHVSKGKARLRVMLDMNALS